MEIASEERRKNISSQLISFKFLFNLLVLLSFTTREWKSYALTNHEVISIYLR